ncbi:MAG: hypothetical protein LBD97_01420 [Bifidobacteriaceae bacterium]|nr:hypothetical protein [Bifidobacteriaceae bacterium]
MAHPEITADFFRRLVKDRVNIEIQQHELGTDLPKTVEFDHWVLALASAAAGVNTAYFSDRADARGGVARSSAATVGICSSSAAWRNAARDLKALENAPLPQSPSHEARMAKGLASRIQAAILDGSVNLGDIQSLTELAWSEFISKLSVWRGYPDWAELIARLELLAANSAREGRQFQAHLENSPDIRMVKGTLKDETERSAKNWQQVINGWPEGSNTESGKKGPAQTELYQNLARLLLRQAELRSRLVEQEKNARQGRLTAFQQRIDPAAASPLPVRNAPGVPAAPKFPPPPDSTSSLKGYPPPAVIYVTTFDLELEFALVSEGVDKFVMVMPVHIIDRIDGPDAEHATTLWVGRVVACGDGPDAPSEERVERFRRLCDASSDQDYFLLSTVEQVGSGLLDDGQSRARADKQIALLRQALGISDKEDATPRECVDELYSLPMIVHLMGAPLVAPPKLEVGPLPNAGPPLTDFGMAAVAVAGLADAWRSRVEQVKIDARAGHGAPHSLVRAASMTLLEEANAIRTSLPEVIPADSSSRRPPRNLPGALWHGLSEHCWRYWALLGVELNDPVIRYRVLAQFLSDGLTRPQVEGSGWPSRTGLAVNQGPLSARASEALRWCGFSVLDGPGGSGQSRLLVTPDHLGHVLSHLEATLNPPSDPARRPYVIDPDSCNLPTTAPGSTNG